MYSTEEMERRLVFLKKNCRSLEQARFEYLFLDGKKDEVLAELDKFQNSDGGFGNGLEPDFWLSDSSPLATTVAFQHFQELQLSPDDTRVKRGLSYFARAFLEDLGRWESAPAKINDYPRAVWWNYDLQKQGTSIDNTWGNPTAEIIAYFWRYDVTESFTHLRKVTEQLISNLLEQTEGECHELYCYLKLHAALPHHYKSQIEDKLIQLVSQTVSIEPSEWKEYKPMPINFVESKESLLYPILAPHIDKNLEFISETVTDHGIWYPTWQWYQYDKEWEQARLQWAGIITINYIKALQAFGHL